MKKIYLAGFSVFADNAVQIGMEMKRLCSEYGFEGLYPLDNECSGAEEIFRANTAMIRECDIVAADMASFRGCEPDSGTAFEVGYACALGKKVYCYIPDGRSLREKFGERDENGYNVEDFGLPLNLMIAVPAKVVCGGLEECLKAAAKDE